MIEWDTTQVTNAITMYRFVNKIDQARLKRTRANNTKIKTHNNATHKINIFESTYKRYQRISKFTAATNVVGALSESGLQLNIN